jgi:hypothetical protein
MKILKLIFACGVGSMLAALLLWISLAVGASDPQRFLALARAGLLVLGLGGCAWGLLWQRVQIVFVGLLLLSVGVLGFLYRV